jgi:hypothetical protein
MIRECEIVYVKEKDASGWKWRSVSADGKVTSSEETFGLFYDCVLAAKASGYTPAAAMNLKCS